MIYRHLLLCLSVLLFATPLYAEESLKEDQKTFYAIGLSIARSLAPFDLTSEELEIVKAGINDVISGKTPAVQLESYNIQIQGLARARLKAKADKVAAINKEFFEKAANENGAIKSSSGLVYLSLKEGSGLIPGPGDTISINYRGTLPDGKEFENTFKWDTPPRDLKINSVMKCWSEGIQKMRTGGKSKLSCPASLAYGENGYGNLVPPGVALAFEIELLDVRKEPQGANHEQL